MANFRIGQRVRKVRGEKCNLGATGKVVGFDTVDEPYDFVVQLDCISTNLAGSIFMPNQVVDAFQKHWEPIVPEGTQPVSWKSCLWQPDGETV